MSTAELLTRNGWAIAAIFLLAGWVKGVVGMGLPLVAMGLLALIMPTAQAATLLIVPSLVTNLWQFSGGNSAVRIGRRLATMMVGVCVGTSLGIHVLTADTSKWPTLVFGLSLALYALTGLFLPLFAVAPHLEARLSPLVGVLTGILTGATGIFSVPAVPYLSALGVSKDELIQALGLSFTVSTLALGIALGFSGVYSTPLLIASVIALLPAIAGMVLGQAIRDRLQPMTFRRWFFVAMLLIGVYMVSNSLVPQ